MVQEKVKEFTWMLGSKSALFCLEKSSRHNWHCNGESFAWRNRRKMCETRKIEENLTRMFYDNGLLKN